MQVISKILVTSLDEMLMSVYVFFFKGKENLLKNFFLHDLFELYNNTYIIYTKCVN